MIDIYLAGPYTHKDKYVVESRYLMLTRTTGYLQSEGFTVFSPITQSHEAARLYDMPTTWEFWRDLDLKYLSNCSNLVVITMDGWESSIGVTDERKYALENDIPTHFWDGKDIIDFKEMMLW